jgi:Flp pilus assembly protein TadD
MAHASDETVRGDFSDARFDWNGIETRFYRQAGRFMVDTDGPDGRLTAFEIKYTFGIEPLQQYLIAFPDGRLQALSIAWDTRPPDHGGQRWFHIYPDEKIGHDDDLHWTKLNQNWNFMCAECHSTGVQRNYDVATDSFNTSFAEISVGCETCHGQGSRHIAWAEDKESWWPSSKPEDATLGLLVRYAERLDTHWSIDEKTGNAARSAIPATLRTEVETCGLCHARRGQNSEGWIPGRWLLDTHDVSNLDRRLYHADGQMLDEVYNYGSFKQSRMFAAGVTCSDCHEPHSGKTRASGDGVCQQCHATEKYATVSHHRHENAGPELSCAACHMPVRTYMVVDRRHDHSFRVPRPDLSVTLGTPNACTDCHKDKTAQWAAAAIDGWFGPARKGFQTYAPAFHAARNELPTATRLLSAVAGDATVPAIARATALAELSPLASPAMHPLAQSGLADSDPMVRIGALDMIEAVPEAQRWALASPLLSDPVGGVRIRAVQVLAFTPLDRLSTVDRQSFNKAIGEFVAAQRLNADRPEARSALGAFFLARGQVEEAEGELKAALKLNPRYAPAIINLADLYRLTGRDADGEIVLREGLVRSPKSASIHHALGLALVRLKRTDEAVASLRTARELEPGEARYGYVYAVALQSQGRIDEAIAALRQTVERSPNSRDALIALITFLRDDGDAAAALMYAEQLAVAYPADTALTELISVLRRKAAAGD